MDLDSNCSQRELEKHLYNLGLSPDSIFSLDIEQSLRRFFAVSAAGDQRGDAEALFDLIRNVRQARRFDLIALCESLHCSSDQDCKVEKEFILLYIDAADWERLRRFIDLRPDITVELKARTILLLLTQREQSSSEALTIWPNEQIGYAAKTAIFNVNAAVITRQRSFIEALLHHLSK